MNLFWSSDISKHNLKNAKNHSYKVWRYIYSWGKETLTTLDAAPPGQQASKIKPTEREGESPRALLIKYPNVGIIVYWATHPNSIWWKIVEKIKIKNLMFIGNKYVINKTIIVINGKTHRNRPLDEQIEQVLEFQGETHGQHNQPKW